MARNTQYKYKIKFMYQYNGQEKEFDYKSIISVIINKDYQNGFYVVSYNNINIGFVKSVNGILKNHFPKGLRI